MDDRAEIPMAVHTNRIHFSDVMFPDGLRDPQAELLKRAEQVIAWLDDINLGSVAKQNLREAIKAAKS